MAGAAPRPLAELAALRCLRVSSRTFGKQEQLAFLSLLAGEYGTCTPKFESSTEGGVSCVGRDPGLIPRSKQGQLQSWHQALAQDFAQSSCEFLLRMEISLIPWASGPALGHPHVKK